MHLYRISLERDCVFEELESYLLMLVLIRIFTLLLLLLLSVVMMRIGSFGPVPESLNFVNLVSQSIVPYIPYSTYRASHTRTTAGQDSMTDTSSIPKRRSDHTSSTPPPKASRMSAAAPVFNPANPLPSSIGQTGDDLEGNTLEGDEGESSNQAAIAAAVAKSRVTRPLPNSRRAAPGADFVPKQATVPKSAEQKENTRRLIVVLSQVCHQPPVCCVGRAFSACVPVRPV